MNNNFKKGIYLTALGSFWWGFLGVIYFKYISFIGHIEVVIHRSIWTTVTLLFTTFIFSKWKIFFYLVKDKKKLFILFFSGILIFSNWAVWIYAVATDRVIDASFGYFVMPIISVFLGYFFFNEEITKKTKLSILIVMLSILYLLFTDFKTMPWIGLLVAILWSLYNLVRKKIKVDTDVGLFIESLLIFPFMLFAFYLITKNNLNNFDVADPSLMFILILAGPMTVIPLFLYVKGVELSGLGPAGMIFYITPTFQFLLGYFIFKEPMNFEKLLSFILIWIAVFIYMKDLYEKK